MSSNANLPSTAVAVRGSSAVATAGRRSTEVSSADCVECKRIRREMLRKFQVELRNPRSPKIISLPSPPSLCLRVVVVLTIVYRFEINFAWQR